MKYEEYIKLGFKRTDITDSVQFSRHGYNGFYLEKNINEAMNIFVDWTELDEPTLYIQKRNSETVHRIKITPEMVKDIFAEKTVFNPHTAC
jgi:hypothetical protein